MINLHVIETINLIIHYNQINKERVMKKLVTVLLFLSIASSFAFAQMQYNFGRATAAYEGNTAGSQFTWTGTADDGYSAPVLIGFPFTYAGVARDTFQVSTNGFFRFGSGLANSTFSNALNGTLRSILAPLWDDLKASDSSKVTYQVTGDAPNRILTVEWKLMHFPYNNVDPNSNFMVKLYETTNIIEYVYGGFVVPTSTTIPTASIGMSNSTTILTASQATGQFFSINIGGIAGARVFHQSMGQEFNGVAAFPDSGTVFTFTPTTPNPLSGNYTVGSGGNFATLSAAAMFLNRNGVSGPVTLTVNSGTYDDIFHLIDVAGTSSTNTIKLVGSGTVVLSPLNGSYSTTSPGAASGDAIIRLEGAQYVTIEGLQLVDNLNNLTTRTKFNMGVLMRNAVYPVSGVATFIGAKYNTIKNVSIDLNAMNGQPNAGAIGIRLGTLGTNATDTLGANSYNTIQNCIIEDFWRAAVQMYGFQGVTNPDRGNRIIGTDGNFCEFRNVNVNAGAAADIRTIEMNAQFNPLIENVKISNIKASVMVTNSVYGIRLNPANSATDHVSGNVVIRNVSIEGIWSDGTTPTTSLAVGMDIQQLGLNSTLLIDKCSIKDIYSNGSTTGRAFGLQMNNGFATGANVTRIQNCYIYDLRAPRSTASGTATGPALHGMNLQATAGPVTYEVYYNTVLLDGNTAPTLAATHSTNLFWGNFGNGVLDLRNNILVNMTQSGTGRNSVLFASSGTNFLKLAATTNNNLLYADTAQVLDVIAYNAALDYVTLADYKAYVTPRDTFAVTEKVPFQSYAAPVNPRINTGMPTQANAGALPIAGVTTDFYGNFRNANTPDIGAEEFTNEVNAPSNLAATSNNPFYVQLTWTDNSGNEEGFYLERKDGDSTSVNAYSVIKTLIAGATSVRDSSIQGSTSYTYRIKAFNGQISSAYSNQAQVVTIVPVELTSFTVTADKNNVNLAWSTATETNSNQFIVERKTAGSEWTEAGTVKAAGTSTTTKTYSFSEKNLTAGKYSYRLKQVDFDGSTQTFDAVEVEVGIPTAFDLSQNYPNPFNPTTRINFAIPTAANVTLEVFDISGQKIATLVSGFMNAGYHFVDMDAVKYGMSSGTYIYKIQADKFSSVKKMILVK